MNGENSKKKTYKQLSLFSCQMYKEMEIGGVKVWVTPAESSAKKETLGQRRCYSCNQMYRPCALANHFEVCYWSRKGKENRIQQKEKAITQAERRKTTFDKLRENRILNPPDLSIRVSKLGFGKSKNRGASSRQSYSPLKKYMWIMRYLILYIYYYCILYMLFYILNLILCSFSEFFRLEIYVETGVDYPQRRLLEDYNFKKSRFQTNLSWWWSDRKKFRHHFGLLYKICTKLQVFLKTFTIKHKQKTDYRTSKQLQI